MSILRHTLSSFVLCQDGNLDRKELRQCFIHLGLDKIYGEQFDQWCAYQWERFDRDKNGFVDVLEFTKAYPRLKRICNIQSKQH